jgi:hypothetical protein
MSTPNPALEKFAAHIGEELLVAQVLIRRLPRGFELRHEADRGTDTRSLRAVASGELRGLAQFTGAGAFRPLKSAPNLVTGWFTTAETPEQLELALNQLYPGFLADWFAARSPAPPITHYREFTERQTGMYRITTMLTDEQAVQMIRVCCQARFCLKRRLWTVSGLAVDSDQAKSMVPCLEPCAILLEFARKAARLEQEEKIAIPLAASELETQRTALEQALAAATPDRREADFNSPLNPRVLCLRLERLKRVAPTD